ncbi:MAG: plasmid fertility inhibition factor family protein [bacterium]
MVKIIGKSSIYLDYCYIYKIKLQNKNSVYMKIVLTNYSNNETYPIIVNYRRFIEYWKNAPESCQVYYELSRGNQKSWLSDYKYHYAEKGFMCGISNPVPIPKIQYINNITPNYITVSDCTRTIWLLSNGAASFPVKCEAYNNAKNVYDFIGEKEFELKSIADLMQ